MPRTKGSKNRPKTNITNDYASQITEKQEIIASLNTEIASIQKAIEEQKSALKKAEKEVATLEAKRRQRQMLRLLKKLRRLKPRVKLSITLDTFPTRIMKRSVRRQPLRRISAALQQEEAHQWTSRSCGCSSNS